MKISAGVISSIQAQLSGSKDMKHAHCTTHWPALEQYIRSRMAFRDLGNLGAIINWLFLQAYRLKMVSTTRSRSLLLLPLVPIGIYAKSLNTSVFNSLDTNYPLTIGIPVCIDPPRARELDLEQVNYRDCIPLLNDILLEPNINHRNHYNATTYYPLRLFRTCFIALSPRSRDGTDVFWGYQIAIAAATAVKHCVEDSVDRYGGIAFTTSRLLFYTQVKNLGEDSKVEVVSTAPSLETGSSPIVIFPTNSTDATLNVPNPAAAIPACQISQPPDRTLSPVHILDCYYLFYKILTDPTVERPIILRGLSPLRYERYGACSLQLRGYSAVSADAIKYIALLLGAVSIVQTCVVVGGLVLGGAVNVGSRGQYFVRVYNSLEEETGDEVQSW